MSSSFLFGRMGNKKPDIKFFKQYLPFENIKTVIEPFGGTFAVIRYCYNDDKYKKIVNDTDEYLTQIYNNPEKFNDLSIFLNNISLSILDNKKVVNYKKFMEIVNNDENRDKIDTKMFEYWKLYNIVRGQIIKCRKTKIDNTDNIALMKKITFSNVDYLEVINKYKNDPEAFIFLDPPYMFSDNSQYTNQVCESDMTDILIKIKEIFNNPETKAKIMFIINDLKIIRWLFDDFVKAEYNKMYSLSKKTQKHLILCNYNL